MFFPVQLTMSRIGNLTGLILTLAIYIAYAMSIHRYNTILVSSNNLFIVNRLEKYIFMFSPSTMMLRRSIGAF